MLFGRLLHYAAARRLMLMWGVLTGVYLAAVIYRVLALQQAARLPTYAGFSAAAAVWFALINTVSPREALKLGALVSLAASVVLNATIVVQTVVSGRSIPGARFTFTVLLVIGFLDTTPDAQRMARFKEPE